MPRLVHLFLLCSFIALPVVMPFNREALLSETLKGPTIEVLKGVTANESSTENVIRHSARHMLDSYFHLRREVTTRGRKRVPIVTDSDTVDTEIESRGEDVMDTTKLAAEMSEETCRQKIISCFDMAQRRMRVYRAVYVDESVISSHTLGLREDDALRLFFVGDLVSCLAHLSDTQAMEYAASPTEASRGRLFDEKQLNQLFFRVPHATPVILGPREAEMLSDIVEKFQTITGNADRNVMPAAVSDLLSRFVSLPPFLLLSGRRGLIYSFTLFVGLAGALSLFSLIPIADSVSSTAGSPKKSSGVDKSASTAGNKMLDKSNKGKRKNK